MNQDPDVLRKLRLFFNLPVSEEPVPPDVYAAFLSIYKAGVEHMSKLPEIQIDWDKSGMPKPFNGDF